MNKVMYLAIFLMIFASGVIAEPVVDSVTFDPVFIEPGMDVTVYVKFHENPVSRLVRSGAPSGVGGNPVIKTENPEIFYVAKLIPVDDISGKFIIVKEERKNVGHLFVGETWTIPFKVKIKEDAPLTSYRLEFQLVGTDINGIEKSIALVNDFEIPVRGIVKFDIDSKNLLKLGTTSDINLGISNVGGGTARYVTVSLEPTNPFTVLHSSENYLGNIKGNEFRDISFTVRVDSNAEANAYKIPLIVKYTDDNGTEHRIEKNIGVEVEAKPDIKVSLEKADDFSAGSKGKITISVVNSGFSDVKFVDLKLIPMENYDVISASDFYIGNLDSDDSESQEFEIQLNENVPVGKIPLSIRVNYKEKGHDAEHTEDVTVDLNVISREELAKKTVGGDILSNIAGIAIVIPLIILAYLGIWFIYKLLGVFTEYINRKIFRKV